MSIAVLTQVYTEARRLAIAGSVVARGDFRLKKLLPPLEAAGKQAPVFAKVAEAATKVIDGPEASSAEALLELTSLVNAVLYTQGETGLAGKLDAVETTDLGGSVVQTSARVLKPLLEALSSTGSGRLELVKDAHERGLFRDLRLVKPALAAIDDPYPEIADLMTEKVLPLYGKAILPELRSKYDPKGTKGHPRRLKLMHAVDAAGTKELVKAALDGGSKEVKVAAIACLGAEDLSFLVEQAAAKAQDVRAAAYQSLARIDKPEAVAVLAKAVAGKDYPLVGDAIENGGNPKLADVLVNEIRTTVDGLPKLKEKKLVGAAVQRATLLLGSFPKGDHPAADALLLDLFARRGDIAKVKGDGHSGSDVGETVIQVMSDASKVTRSALVAAHASLAPDELRHAVDAGRQVLSAAAFYDTFAPYLTAGIGGKKDAAAAKRDVVAATLGGGRHTYWWWHDDHDADLPPLDPRWLDSAVRIKYVNLVRAVGRPGHAEANAFLSAEHDRLVKAAKSQDELMAVLSAMIRLDHPDAATLLTASYLKAARKTSSNTYWYHHYVRRLPKTAIPVLEAIVPQLKDRHAENWLEAIEELRTKA